MLAIIALLGILMVHPGSSLQLANSIIRLNESNDDNLSANNTSLQAHELSIISQAPKIIVIGNGYYADHPVNYSSQFGRQTWLKNRVTGASMNHEVGSASGMSQMTEMSARDIQQRDEWGMSGYSGIQMKVSEDVQGGRVNIGVLQGGTSGAGMPPSATALRNPTLEIDEDYIGTFHIEKNISIHEPVRQIWQNYSWLPCCTWDHFDIPESERKHLSAERIFNPLNEK